MNPKLERNLNDSKDAVYAQCMYQNSAFLFKFLLFYDSFISYSKEQLYMS